MKRRLPAVLAALTPLPGCALSRGEDELTQNMNRLVGHPVSEVAIILGPPKSQTDVGNGTRAFQYQRSESSQTAAAAGCLISVTATSATPRSTRAEWIIQSWDGTACS